MQKFFACFFLIITFLTAQEINIVEILDANLFKTADGTLISMVNLEVPSLADEDSSCSALAKYAVQLAKMNLLKQKVRFEKSTKEGCTEKSIIKGHLFRVYPLSDTNINELYLKKGYAVYSPCDTKYMQEYREANLFSMNKRLGIWKPVSKRDKPDMFNRFRFSFLILQEKYNQNLVLPPLIGFNYRWSDVITFIDYNEFSLNASIEAGTFVYFALPYGTFGAEARYKNFYLRGHHDRLIPVFFFLSTHDVNSVYFWGIDVGMIFPFGRKGLELEYNIKTKDGFNFYYFSVSFAAY